MKNIFICFGLFISLLSFQVQRDSAGMAFWPQATAGAASDKDHSRVSFWNDVTVQSNETVDNLVVFGGDATVQGIVEGDAVVLGGNLGLKPGAKVEGDAVVLFGSILKDERAEIEGDRVVFGGGSILKRLAGAWLPVAVAGSFLAYLFGIGLASMLAKFVVFFVLGVLCLTFLAKPFRRVADCLSVRPGRAVLDGFLFFLLLAPMLLLLAVSIVGIPLIPLVVLCYVAAFAFGYVAAAFSLGTRVAERLFGHRSAWVSLVCGLVFLRVLAWIPVLGWPITALVVCFALGAVWLTRFGTREMVPTPTLQNKNEIESNQEERK